MIYLIIFYITTMKGAVYVNNGRNLYGYDAFTGEIEVYSDIHDDELSKMLQTLKPEPYSYRLVVVPNEPVNPNLHPTDDYNNPLIFTGSMYELPQHVPGIYWKGRMNTECKGYKMVELHIDSHILESVLESYEADIVLFIICGKYYLRVNGKFDSVAVSAVCLLRSKVFREALMRQSVKSSRK